MQMSFGSLGSHSATCYTPKQNDTLREQLSTQFMKRYTENILIKTRANLSCLPSCSMMLETVPKSFSSTSSGRIIVKSSTGGRSWKILNQCSEYNLITLRHSSVWYCINLTIRKTSKHFEDLIKTPSLICLFQNNSKWIHFGGKSLLTTPFILRCYFT